MLRYLKRLEDKDIALNRTMIALGSCTMKLNAAAEMIPISWKEFAEPHPFVPIEQMEGFRDLFTDLKNWLRSITGFSGVSLQPRGSLRRASMLFCSPVMRIENRKSSTVKSPAGMFMLFA